MKTHSIYRPLFVSLVAVALLFAFGYMRQPTPPASGGHMLRLEPPSFVKNASAATDAPILDIGALLDQEAGISAYFKSPDVINLNQVRSQFSTIETETADYIIGSVPVANYVETAEPHVYVHRNGWILAYYMRSDPVSKIIDTLGSSITTSKLKNVVAVVASAAGAPFTDVTYYDFRYPNATHMMLIAENWENGNDFTVQLPSTYGYFERGWALNNIGCGSSHSVWLDGVELLPVGGDAPPPCDEYGSITAAQLLPDVTHTVAVSQPDWGAMVILYRVP